MENTSKYYIEVVLEGVLGDTYLFETKQFDTREEALNWYHTSFVTAGAWECSIRLVGTKYDKNGFKIEDSCEELRGI